MSLPDFAAWTSFNYYQRRDPSEYDLRLVELPMGARLCSSSARAERRLSSGERIPSCSRRFDVDQATDVFLPTATATSFRRDWMREPRRRADRRRPALLRPRRTDFRAISAPRV